MGSLGPGVPKLSLDGQEGTRNVLEDVPTDRPKLYFFSPAIRRFPVLSWKAPSAACGKEMEVWAGFEQKHSSLEGEEQEDKTVLEREVLLRQLLHQTAIEC